ncbi:MAG: DegT/DnrJ/EryC1/StrS family aminotransferase [Deltaproteobacteria bacterium]|nr:DegT/DnrJ/EryC1/StrS family aminotransferase [Deltaproteobacteria bacterium]MBW2359607.1 DegT/DnrJ/EryC1/StrS family aminotransferase [Deltaproteobacteria bacterium]
MWARARFDISLRDILFGLRACSKPPDREALEREIEELWSPNGDAMVCFSVRTAFDLALQALDLPSGSEVLFSALNIKGMPKIARRLGLVPIPVDLDIDTMAPLPESLERAVSPRARAIVVAPLMGSRFDLAPVIEFARHHDLLVIEDCAQAFNGRSFTGHPDADLSLFSFGTLKFSTALGGALVRVRDAALLARMREIQAGYSLQKIGAYRKRLLKFAGVNAMTARPLLAVGRRLFDALGTDYEDTLSEPVRSIAKLGSANKIRKRPSAPLLALLKRRILDFGDASLEPRRVAGRLLLGRLQDAVICPGWANKVHNFWVFPVVVDDPQELMRALRNQGFDAATLRRSEAVAPPKDRPELVAEAATRTMANLVVLPCYPAMPAREIERQARIVREVVGATPEAAPRVSAEQPA